MQPFRKIDAVAAPMRDADIDTDQILPARFMFKRRQNYGEYCFYDMRIDEKSGHERADFILNMPYYKNAKIIVCGPNFGCGSAREQAVHALKDYGVMAFIGTNFGDIFYSNCLKNGLLPIVLNRKVVLSLFEIIENSPGVKILIDLNKNYIRLPDGKKLDFSINKFYQMILTHGLDEIDYTLSLSECIDAYESRNKIRK